MKPLTEHHILTDIVQGWHGVTEVSVFSRQFLWDRKFFYTLLCGICPFTRVKDLSVIKLTQPPETRTVGSFQGDYNDFLLPGQLIPEGSLPNCTGLLCMVRKAQKQCFTTVELKLWKISPNLDFSPPPSFCHLTFSLSLIPQHPRLSHLTCTWESLYDADDIWRRSSRKQATALVSLARDPSSAEPSFVTQPPALQAHHALQPGPPHFLEPWLRNHEMNDKFVM